MVKSKAIQLKVVFYILVGSLLLGSPLHAGGKVGDGAIDAAIQGPQPAFEVGGNGFKLVKNWDFGTSSQSTITNYDQLSEHFQYHDQFGTIANGTNYGALIVAPNEKVSLTNRKQPIEGRDTNGKPIREFLANSMKTYLIPLNGATELHPEKHNVGCGSFQAKWTLPKGGKLLGKDMLWETRVRYKTPPYFWFAIWTCGNKWSKGAEVDVVESFGYDNGGGYTNFDGRFWHANYVGGYDESPYKSWSGDMKKYGITNFQPEEFHVWTMLYTADDMCVLYMDGQVIQRGNLPWTLKAEENGEPLNMSFIFDGGWGHVKVNSVNKPLKAADFEGTYYEWDYSRVYLRDPVQ